MIVYILFMNDIAHAGLAGCLLAVPVGPFSPENCTPLMGCLCAWACVLVWRIATGRSWAERPGRDVRMAAAALIGALLPGLALAHGLFYNILAACTAGIVAAAAAASFASTIRPPVPRSSRCTGLHSVPVASRTAAITSSPAPPGSDSMPAGLFTTVTASSL